MDLALSLALLDQERYKAVSERLRRAGFEPDENDDGNKTRHRWRIKHARGTATVEFLIEPSQGTKPGRVQNLEKDIAAIAMRGMHLAFEDFIVVPLEGKNLNDDTVKRDIKVCGPGAFVILKALAIQNRSEDKDPYDLFMVLRYFENGPSDVARRLVHLRADEDVAYALTVLKASFSKDTDPGPAGVARFFERPADDNLKQDVLGAVQDLLRALK